MKLTNNSLQSQCVPPGPGTVTKSGRPVTQKLYWDEALPGFGVLVGPKTKTFVVQRDVAGAGTKRRKIGRFPLWTVEQARKEARELLLKLDKGIDPLAERKVSAQQARVAEWQRFTLRQALAEHMQNMRKKGCSPRSIAHIEDEVTRLLGDWLDKPLITIRRKDCSQRHTKLSETKRVAANRVLRSFRACWNSAQGLFEELPPHPVRIVFNKQSRRRSPIPWEQLPTWWASVDAIENPVRRDLNILILLTGLRSEDARTIRWEHVDFDKGSLHRPKPKGGEDRAFTIPLCAHLLGMLAKRQLDNRMRFQDDGGWVFATRDSDGAITHTVDARHTKYSKDDKGVVHKVTMAPTPHRLRDTFATACLEAGIGFTETKVLMNHVLPDEDVTQGYQRPSLEHLRGCVEKIAGFLLGKAGAVASSEQPVRKGA